MTRPSSVFTADNAPEMRKIIQTCTFLDLEHLFSFDVADWAERVAAAQPTLPRRMTFSAFRKRLAKDRIPMVRKLLSNLQRDDPHLKRETELEESLEYNLKLDPQDFTMKLLEEHFSRFQAHAEEALQAGNPEHVAALRTSVREILLPPVLKWVSGNPGGMESKRVLEILEALTEVTHTCFLRQPVYARLLEFHNALMFTYIVTARVFGLGLSAPTVCRHLMKIRLASTVSWAELPPGSRLQFGALALKMAIAFFPLEEAITPRLGFSRNSLMDLRCAMVDAAGAGADIPLLVHEWVFRWMQDKLDAEVFSTRSLTGNRLALASLTPGEQSGAAELVRRFSGFRIPVTADYLERFLLQFETTQRIRGILRLLTHTRFFPYWELAEAIQQQLRPDIGSQRLVLAPLGDRTGSTSIINYLLSHSTLAADVVFAEDISQALSQTQDDERIYFVDDCLLSGTQTLSIIGDLMGTRPHKPHHTIYGQPLSAGDRARLEKRRLAFVYCVATDVGLQRTRRDLPNTGIDPGRVELRYASLEQSASRAFETLSPVAWSSAAERDDLKAFATEVGYDILSTRAKRKDWADERRRESALGFSDFQRLLVFPYNVPKTTVTLLWERGSEGRVWAPLFPGYG